VPHAHLDQDGAGDGALLTIDDRFGSFGAEAAPDDLAVVVEDGLAFFIEPAAVNRLNLVPGGRFRIVSALGLSQVREILVPPKIRQDCQKNLTSFTRFLAPR